MPDRTIASARSEVFVQQITAQMTTLARTLSAWVQAEPRPLQVLEAQVVRVLHDLGTALLTAFVALAAPPLCYYDVRQIRAYVLCLRASKGTNMSSHSTTTEAPTDTEVRPAKRAPRSAAERLRILEEYESYPAGSPERGALLRREGVYTSSIAKWRKLRRNGALTALTTQGPGLKPAPQDPVQDELAQLRAENSHLQARLAQAEAIVEIQKKWRRCLGRPPR